MKNKAIIALASPKTVLADPIRNAGILAEYAEAAAREGARLIAFPELALTGATLGDLFKQTLLTDKAESALGLYIEKTKDLDIVSFVGLPVSMGADFDLTAQESGYIRASFELDPGLSAHSSAASRIYNAVAVIKGGEILGITPSALASGAFSPAPMEEKRIFISGRSASLCRRAVYDIPNVGGVYVSVGDDNKGAPSTDAALVINTISKYHYMGLSEALENSAASYAEIFGVPVAVVGSGEGESGTDGICAGVRFLADARGTLARAELFSEDILYAELGSDNVISAPERAEKSAPVRKFPFLPESSERRAYELDLAFMLQSRALAHRMERSYTKKLVIGVSGGLDSTLAVLAAAKAVDLIGLPRENIIAITMPCFGTTERTKGNALSLAEALGCTVRTIDIKASVNLHFEDIGHDKNNYNVVYENAQARERTQILMDVANAEGGLVVGTGDLSELALGFATYNGDHMSMYAVNASIPKTLMREMIRRSAELLSENGDADTARVLLDVINTPVSPELLPVGEESENAQHTEKIVGPYELHDFFLYYTVKHGFAPSLVLSLAIKSFPEYSEEEMRGYLDIFIRRFYSQQFKRSCLPDGPKVTEISLSPRGAWSMPSDVSSALFRDDIKQ